MVDEKAMKWMEIMNKKRAPDDQIRLEGDKFISRCGKCRTEIDFGFPTQSWTCQKCGNVNQARGVEAAGLVIKLVLIVLIYLLARSVLFR